MSFFLSFQQAHAFVYLLLLLAPLGFKISVRMAHLLSCTMLCICLRCLPYYFLEIVHEELILSFLFILGCTRTSLLRAGFLFMAVHRLLIAVLSLVVGHKL